MSNADSTHGTQFKSSFDILIYGDWRSPYDHDAELLVERLADWPRLAEEIVQDLQNDRTVNADIRREAIRAAIQRGDASYLFLLTDAWRICAVLGRSPIEYERASRRAMKAAEVAPLH